jgi:hypothetical protein
LVGIDFLLSGLYHPGVAGKRHSLAMKIAAANTLLAVFAVVTVVACVLRKDRRLLEWNICRELAYTVAAGALLFEETRAEPVSAPTV